MTNDLNLKVINQVGRENFRPISTSMQSINFIYLHVQDIQTYNKNFKNLIQNFYVSDLDLKVTQVGRDGAALNLRPISTIMQSINLIHQHVQEI